MENQIAFFGFFIFLAFILYAVLPRYRNPFFGYKTPFALQNDDTAKEANTCFARTFLITQLIGFILFFALSYTHYKIENYFVITGIFILPAGIITVIMTETHLKKTFDENGKRKKPNNK